MPFPWNTSNWNLIFLPLLKIAPGFRKNASFPYLIIQQFKDNHNRLNLKLKGSELISVIDVEKGINPSDIVKLEIKYISGEIKSIDTLCRIDTKNELEYYKNGGILQYVLRNMF